MKAFIAFLALVSIQAFAEDATSCRLAIHDMNKLMGQNTVLNDQVIRILEKKNIFLVNETELSKGDFLIPNLIAVYNGFPNIPMHEFKFATKTRATFVPCLALPLCSPVVIDREVTDIVGIKYKHDYTINVVSDTGTKIASHKRFKHTFKEKPTSWNREISYDGSADQEDLSLAIADTIPKCSKLRKLIKN